MEAFSIYASMVENKTSFEEVLKLDLKNLQSAIKIKNDFYFNYIYVLLKGGEIVYIGKSKNHPTNRLQNHSTGCYEKDFDDIKVLKIEGEHNEDLLIGTEAHLIIKNKPKYNKSLPRNCYWARPKRLKQILKISHSRYKEITKGANMSRYKEYYNGLLYLDVLMFKKDFL